VDWVREYEVVLLVKQGGGFVVDLSIRPKQSEGRLWYRNIVSLSGSQVRELVGNGSRLVDFWIRNAREDEQHRIHSVAKLGWKVQETEWSLAIVPPKCQHWEVS
jgi:hypothetical protein